MPRKYPQEVKELIESLIDGRTNRQVAEELQKHGYDLDENKVKTYLNNHHIKRKVRGKVEYPIKIVLTAEEEAYVLENYHHIGAGKMAQLLNENFGGDWNKGRVKTIYKRLHIKSDQTGRFEKGCIPWCKGKKVKMKSNAGWFKKGESIVTKEIGTIVKRHDTTWIKIGMPNRWQQYSRYIYEQTHNVKLTQADNVIFKDGNYDNFDPDNLMAVTAGELRARNVVEMRQYKNADMTEAAIYLARLDKKLKERK